MKKSSLQNVKSNNKAVVLNCLRSGAASRAEIVKKSGLSKATVTIIVNEFINDGRIKEMNTDLSGTAGRPSVPLELVPDYRFCGGFSLHRKLLTVCVTNLKAEPIDSISAPTETFSTAKEAINFLYDGLINLLKKHKIPYSKLIGIGISSPGPLDYRNGVILNPTGLEIFHDFDIKKFLAEKTELPVFLDNNSVLLAMSEDNSRNENFKSYMFVVVSDGIGSAVITDGNIYRGAGGFSGELGHICINTEGPYCECGNTGCLEKYITQPQLKKLFGFNDYKALANAAEKGDATAIRAIDYIALNFSAALISCINLFDLEAVVVFGDFSYKYEILYKKIQDYVNLKSCITKAHQVKILPAIIEDEAKVYCSVSAVLRAYFEQRL